MARVKDIVRGEVITVGIGTAVVNVAKIIAEKDIGALLATHEEKVVGIVIERDLVRKLLASSQNPAEAASGSCMSAPLISIDPDAPLSEAAKVCQVIK